MDIIEFVDNIFSQEELIAFSNITPNSVDVENLKKTGSVTIITKREDDRIIETIEYQSFNGKVNFTKCKIRLIDEEVKNKITELNEIIHTCVQREDYEAAANYAKQRDALLTETTK
jgi:protein-arginine kinase activator protein McsA